ncbi:ATP-grasp fold amidoligase family protein [Algibacter luteus]|uniref:ATP-grasp fold amidoligase family protein n=1 Tax=Algibacter luteus TaxID=1178825 RepID=UPI002594E494|nr:ATP-grasp fold amidoligase family protein [Algibacter luteus]WJJ95492.1 ATP-grasp fold amidoligase family protein [Algibacter luteus]
MKSILKYLYKKTIIGNYIISKLLDLNEFYLCYIKPEKKYLTDKFERNFGRKIDLNNPKTLNEKIVWLILNDRTPLHTQCADKFAVRDYIKSKISEEYLVPLHFQTYNVNDIEPNNLPNDPFIIKTNHDSGGGIIVKNKNSIDWVEVRKNLKARMKHNYYYKSKEWQYKNIKPCIIVEKLLLTKTGDIPFDYKIHCFNGKANMIQVDIDRNSNNHYRNWYNTKWEREPYKWTSIKDAGKTTEPSKEDVEKPKSLDEMLELSEKLSQDFAYVRVDWYDLEGKLYFGELTFHHDGGNRAILPEKYDEILGQKLVLPMKTSSL